MLSPRLSRSSVSVQSLLVSAAAILLALAAYFPSLSTYLAFDDYPHIAPLYAALDQVTPASLWEAVWSSASSGPTGRPLAMASFAVQVGLLGAGPVQLKVFNLLVHLLMGLALYRFAALALAALRSEPQPSSSSRHIAAAAALIWLLHPINLTSVAYLIQRMNSLSALFTILALIAYVRLRTGPTSREGYITGGSAVALLWACGILSKENAALLPAYLLAVELTLLRHVKSPWSGLTGSRAAKVALTLLGLIALGLAAVWIQQRVVGGYVHRPFTLEERLLTEARVVAWYLRLLVAPDIREMSLYHDDWTVSTSLLDPPTTLLSILFLSGLLAAGVALRRRSPVVAFGILWFFAGHLLESTLLPLELVFEHRNYLPGFGLFLAAAWVAADVLNRLPKRRLITGAVLLLVVGGLAGATHLRAQRWSDDPGVRLADLERQDRSVRAHIEAAQTYSDLGKQTRNADERAGFLSQAEAHFAKASALVPDSPEPLFGWLMFRFEHQQPYPHNLVTELVRRLPGTRVSSTAINGMHALNGCVVRGPCAALSDRLPEVFDAAFSSPSLGGSNRNRLLRDLARYRFHVQGNPGAATELLGQAVELMPRDLATRIDYAYLAALAGNRKVAFEQLEQAAELDWLGRKAYTLRRLRSAILAGLAAPSPERPISE